jgi:hypothetical protein
MSRILFGILLVGLLGSASLVAARDFKDIKDGKLLVEPEKDAKFSVEGYVMGKAQLFGYVSDLKDRETFDGIVLEEGGDDAQRAAIRSIAATLELDAFERNGSEIVAIGE